MSSVTIRFLSTIKKKFQNWNEYDWSIFKMLLSFCLASVVMYFVAHQCVHNRKQNNVTLLPQKIKIWSSKDNMDVQILKQDCDLESSKCEIKLSTGQILVLYCGNEKCHLK